MSRTFAQLGITDSFRKALEENGILDPTPIQQKAIPFLLEKGTDLIAQAQTGTGKTAAFGLPLLQKLDPANPKVQALVLAPTRELCQQIAKQLFRFTKYGPRLFSEAVYGGAAIGDQMKALQRPTHIVVATPGRLIDLLEREAVDLSQVRTVVLDEADEMLSMGFKKELDQILAKTRGKRYTWLFSATMPPDIQAIIKKYMAPDAHRIQVDAQHQVNKDIDHRYIICEENEKLPVLLDFLRQQEDSRGLVFCKTKNGAQTLAKQLSARNYPSEALHGDLQQRERDRVMRAFRNRREFQTLIATDVAARGIHLDDMAYVVHYQLPDQLEYYTHRSGRTARAGKKGYSVALVTPRELADIKALEKALDIKIRPL
ncbi:DEAD/DEAH box helicase [Cesiribacter andamanensis]|uniref:DEAD-box ATP-dependent RNA helicase CshA n=1 Tax=Cesiribacter andamanensis AMV16 TaxID=1279009 RepID=M7NJ61_9BACT|nr:DEAD/DEAH box helicase [Cesiribacter andamanensis]EMR01795.1 DEAD-box ATP-dependent RNA helicase CshA [Cesiribacter andamanensis AMV16]